MSSMRAFRAAFGIVHAVLPFDLSDRIAGWKTVRSAMLKKVAPEFTRDEWAYLIMFLEEQNLRRPFEYSFGEFTDGSEPPVLLVRPRGSVGLWLPNNVSLLGPLMLIIVSLSGNAIRMKAGSRSEDLTGHFLEFAKESAATGELAVYLREQVCHQVFSSEDSRNRDMALSSDVRIVFGSDDAAAAIHALPHPVESIGISFTDRRSEAWLELDRCDDSTLRDLIKVFAIYGQAGCTSPSRTILINADRNEALRIRDRLCALWPAAIRRLPKMNVASENVRSWQLARAAGWDSELVPENRAVVSVGDYSLNTYPSLMELRIIAAPLAKAIESLPPNIQTIGHALRDPRSPRWLEAVSQTKSARFVPLGTMHHFETIWDGQDFFSRLFTYTRVQR